MVSFQRIVPLFVMIAVLASPGTAQLLDSVGTGFTKVLDIREHPDPNNRDRVTQQILGGLDLNENGKKEFLYVTDNTFTGGRDGGARGYSLFLYEYDQATSTYKNIWYYAVEDIVGGSFPNFCICDLDGDKHMEVALGINYDAGMSHDGAEPNRLIIFEFGPGDLPIEPIATYNFDNPVQFGNTRPNALFAADVDDDGQQELGIGFRAWNGSAKGTLIASLSNSEYGLFTTFDKEAFDTTTATASIYGTARVTDLDNDGRKEFCFGYGGLPKVVLFEADAANTYTRYEWELATGTTFRSGTSFSMQQADIDKDGKNELLIGSNSNTAADLYIIKDVASLETFGPSNVFRIGRIPPVPSFTDYTDEFRGLAAGDIDGNGKMDIFMCNGGRVWRFEYDGVGSITDSTSYAPSIVYQDATDGTRFRWVEFTGDVYARAAGLPAGDMNGNGKAELMLCNQRGGYADSTSSKIIILESTIAVQRVSAVIGATPNGFELRAAYPNPFNPSTTISFSVGSRATVGMTIYNLLGQEMTTLVNQSLAPGSYTVSWNAGNVPSGIYFCRLKAGSFEQTQKLILSK